MNYIILKSTLTAQNDIEATRDDSWLEANLADIIENNFCDIPIPNSLFIKFGANAVRRLGSIRERKSAAKRLSSLYGADRTQSNSIIIITGIFRYSSVPDFVVRSTIAHEMVHYAHGFSSPLPQKFNHPHRGRLIEKELAGRGLLSDYSQSQAWLNENWIKTIKILRTFRII